MKQYLRSVGTQATAILLAALGAAAVAFFQSMASATGVCEPSLSDPTQVGVLGGSFKAMHSVFLMKHA